jgi:hypothetical protein
MVRFIGNFILFGIIFYLIYLFFPEAFAKLVEWAGDLHKWVLSLFNGAANGANNPPPANHP